MELEKKIRIGIIGLGYVGLPLAIAFSRKYIVDGYDTNRERIETLKQGVDHTLEFTSQELGNKNLNFHSNPTALKDCTIYIVTVPTPLNKELLPDFSFLEKASIMLSSLLSKEDIVVYESTVFPGATEEICIPILEQNGMKLNEDFFVGYSPERINVGDTVNTLENIPKIVAASNSKSLEKLTEIYQSILKAEVYKAPSIKVAEAAKVIENTQRDVNIAFVNELAMMFSAMGLDTQEVLNAASTKWNFLNFIPGLVGGHCIGIDPYYLAHKAREVGYQPNLLLTAREVNENVPNFISKKIINQLESHKLEISKVKALLLGIAFKENTPDIRNSKALTLAENLYQKGINLSVFDPFVDVKDINVSMKILESLPTNEKFDLIILAVGHKKFEAISPFSLLTEEGFCYDIKNFFPPNPRIIRF